MKFVLALPQYGVAGISVDFIYYYSLYLKTDIEFKNFCHMIRAKIPYVIE